MDLPLITTFREMESTPQVEAVIAEQTAKLEKHCPELISCRVTIEGPQGGKHGGHYHVTVDATLPGAEIVANRDPAQKASHEDCEAAVRDAFRAALRELDRFNEKRRKNRRERIA